MPTYSSYSNQPIDPHVDKFAVRAALNQAGKSALERAIIYAVEIVKFVVRFIVDGIKSVINLH